jgi:ATP/maltotriose-dependent transcriptional regulator MalT
VLDAQAPDVRRFLLVTSGLPVLTPASVHDEVGPDGAQILAALQRLNVFLQAVPGEPGHHRYPPFFQLMLRAQHSYELRIHPATHLVNRISDQRTRSVMVPRTTVCNASAPNGGSLLVETLTPKEFEVLGHLQELLTTKEIAGEMYVSVNTVRTHVRHILRKLGVTRRYAAVRRARELGLVSA